MYKIESWIAIDDMNLEKPNNECKKIMNNHFVKIDPNQGLTLEKAKIATFSVPVPFSEKTSKQSKIKGEVRHHFY